MVLNIAPPATPLSQVIRPTTLIEPLFLSERLGAQVTIASETFQHTGSFKFRAAYNVALQAPQTEIIAASSGNFGQALAYACKLLNKGCIVVMPSNSAAVKVDAVRRHGAVVDLVDTKTKSRAQRVAEIAAEHPDAYISSAYDDDFVIEGNATLGRELAALGRHWDAIVAPVGGGGLISGLAQGLRSAGNRTALVGAEPLLGNDAARSLRAGHIVANESEPATIADGARTVSLGKRNWPIIQREVQNIIEVSDENLAEAVRLLFRLANLKVEPTGALGVAALLEQPARFRSGSVCCVVSGGNVDPAVYARVLTGEI
jgi:threonine dehydratase